MLKILLLLNLSLPLLLFSQITEEEAAKRVYAHLIVRDVRAAIDEAKIHLVLYPNSKILQKAYIQALCERGEIIEALDQWAKATSLFEELKSDRQLMETIAWGVLNKGEKSSQFLIRLNALIAASSTRDARALPLILEELRGSNALLRSLAVRMCAFMGDTPLQQELLRLLKEEKVWYVRLEVIRSIGQLNMKAAREFLKEIVGNPKALVEEKAAASIALVQMYETLERSEWQALSKSDRAGLRELACGIIAHLDLKEYAEDVVNLLKDPSFGVRTAALSTLGLLHLEGEKGKEISKAIQNCFEDSSPEVAITAGWAALVYGDKEGLKCIEKGLQGKDPDTRRLAAGALAASGNLASKFLLQHLKKCSDSYVRVTLALSLIFQRMHVKEACDILYEELTSPKRELWMWDESGNPLFRRLGPSRLRHMDEIPHYPALIDQLVCLDLFSALSILKHPKAQEALRGYLKSQSQNQNWGTVGTVAGILLQQGEEGSLELVEGLLQDPEEKVRIQAALILALLGGDPKAVRVLQEAYPFVDREIKAYILGALGHIGDAQSIPFLLEVLKEPFQLLRVAAASALIQCLYH